MLPAKTQKELACCKLHNAHRQFEGVLLQEEDVIGVLPEGDKIAKLKPLGDRILIKVSSCYVARVLDSAISMWA
jgi:hypothetical protein